MHKILPALFCFLFLAGCEQLGIEDPAKAAAAKEAEGRAIGSACRHSGRALEDCFTLNPKVSKAAIFSGWRDMDAYMRENNIESVTPTLQKLSSSKSSARKEQPPSEENKPESLEEGKAPSKEAQAEAQKNRSAASPQPSASVSRGKMA